jgi:nickel-dependent lactate racemase
VKPNLLKIEGEFFSQVDVTIPGTNWIELNTKRNISSLQNVNRDILKMKLKSPVDSNELQTIARSKKKCVILVDDPSRPTPTQIIIPLIIEELKLAGILDENILLFIAKGTHKTYDQERIREKLGDLVYKYKVIQNESHIDDDYQKVGNFKSGRELYVHRKVMECDLKIGVGQIILSPFAGFTGGAKIVLPGACNDRTIFQNHLMAFDPDARVGEVNKNPVRIDMNEAAEMIDLNFIFNVTVDHKNQIIFAACGNPKSVFELGVRTLLNEYSIEIADPLDLVLYNTFPSDRSLYYTISKADIGELAVKKEGSIVVIGSCREGIGEEKFYPLLEKTPDEIKRIADAGSLRADWAGVSYRLTKIMREKKIVVFVPGRIKEAVTIHNENLIFCDDLNNFIQSYLKNKPNAKIGYISSQFALPIINRN